MKSKRIPMFILGMAAALTLVVLMLPPRVSSKKAQLLPQIQTTNPSTKEPPVGDALAAEEYVQMHLSDLSPVQPWLGGRFYITSIRSYAGLGTVYYEDGHHAHVADFAYTVDRQGRPTVTDFKVR
jgi:hypothetical protein